MRRTPPLTATLFPCVTLLALLAIGLLAQALPAGAQDDGSDTEADTYDTKVPPGMELKQLGSKPSVRAVLPIGSTIRKQGDVRIIEGSGEYASRKFIAYDARFDKVDAELNALRTEMEEMQSAIAELKKQKLSSAER